MTTNIATTREQSARLLQCGVDPKTADMFYQVPITLSQKQRGEDILLIKKPDKTLYNIDTPAWSLSALLAILPMRIEKHYKDYVLHIQSHPDEEECYRWAASYSDEEGETILIDAEGSTPIEAVVQLIEELTLKNHKLNEL